MLDLKLTEVGESSVLIDGVSHPLPEGADSATDPQVKFSRKKKLLTLIWN